MARIYPLDLGSIEIEESLIRLHTGFGRKITIPVIAWYIDDADDAMLVDTGFESETVAEKEHHMKATRTPEQTLEASLRKLKVKLADIPTVICTHLHWDHAGNLSLFKNSRIIVQRKELDFALNPLPPVALAYDRWNYENIRFETVDGGIQLSASVSLLFTPGHTPGHQSVLVQTKQGVIALAGDLIADFYCLENNTPPGFYTSIIEAWGSMDKLRRTAQTILPSHDSAVLTKAYP